MSNMQWGHLSDDSSQQESVREIIKSGQPEARILIRQIFHEQIDEAVRTKITRMMRNRDPWYAVETDKDPTREIPSS